MSSRVDSYQRVVRKNRELVGRVWHLERLVNALRHYIASGPLNGPGYKRMLVKKRRSYARGLVALTREQRQFSATYNSHNNTGGKRSPTVARVLCEAQP